MGKKRFAEVGTESDSKMYYVIMTILLKKTHLALFGFTQIIGYSNRYMCDPASGTESGNPYTFAVKIAFGGYLFRLMKHS
jgi:hypothetical protein